MMNIKAEIKIVFFARLREITNTSELSMNFEQLQSICDNELLCVSDVMNSLKLSLPKFKDYLDDNNQVFVAINQEVVSLDTVISSGDIIAFFPPVTGG